MVKQFKRRPFVIEAVQWNGTIERGNVIKSWSNGRFYTSQEEYIDEVVWLNDSRYIESVDIGDWIFTMNGNVFDVLPDDKFKFEYEELL